jgi:hypothetical protein
MGVVEEGAGRVRHGERIGVRRSGRDRRLAHAGDAVLLERHVDAVPMDRGRLLQTVGDLDADPLARLGADRRPGHLAVVGVGADHHRGKDVPADDAGRELELAHAVDHARSQRLRASRIRARHRRSADIDRPGVVGVARSGRGGLVLMGAGRCRRRRGWRSGRRAVVLMAGLRRGRRREQGEREEGTDHHPSDSFGRQLRSVSALATTLTEEKAMAAPATTGLRSPTAATGMPTRL